MMICLGFCGLTSANKSAFAVYCCSVSLCFVHESWLSVGV